MTRAFPKLSAAGPAGTASVAPLDQQLLPGDHLNTAVTNRYSAVRPLALLLLC